MVELHPFRAIRPIPELASVIASVPYDVVNTEEAARIANGNPNSFLHIVRPEIDVPDRVSDYEDRVYEMGAKNLAAYIASERSIQEDEPALYLYRLVMNGRSQSGIFGCVSVRDYDENTILKHELTRPSKEDDRTRHIVMQRAHAEPVMLTFKDDPQIEREMTALSVEVPLYDLVSDDGVRHSIWKFPDAKPLVDYFGKLEKLYVADGHHRCKAASRAAHENSDKEPGHEVNFFPAVLFPMGQMKILPYNRIIRSLPQGSEEFTEALKRRFDIEGNARPSPERKGTVSMYMNGKWFGLRFPDETAGGVISTLDVDRLSRHLLEPILSITDPRTDPNIDFVGGIRGTGELQRLVDEGKAAIAFSMYATSIEELVAVSDAGQLMPPKSTWFEPKLRSGFLVHVF